MEFTQFRNLNKNLRQICNLKKKSFNFEQKLDIFFGFNFRKTYPKELLFTKYEQIF